MSETEFFSVVSQYGFTELGRVAIENGRLKFNLVNRSGARGFVYLWVEGSDQGFTIVYVGMAGRTLQSRCSDHEGGFTKSSTGKAHAKRFRDGIEAGRRYAIYARKGETRDVLGQSGIPMVSVEELAFIDKFKPSWNFAKGARGKSLRPVST